MKLRATGRAAPGRLGRALRTPFAATRTDPIFILGNQKSGTSAIAGLLGKMTGESVTIDLLNEDRRTIFQRCITGEVAFARLVERNRLDFARRIVKEPNLTLFFAELRHRFPEAQFAFIVRDPRDSVRSLLNWMGLPGNAEDLSERQMRTLRPSERGIVDGRWLGLTGNGYVEMLAQRWNFLADVYLDCPQASVLQRYEDFMLDKAGSIARLATLVGLTPTSDLGDKVDFQYQPAGKRDVVWSGFFGAENLWRIESICGDRMRRFGYTSGDRSGTKARYRLLHGERCVPGADGRRRSGPKEA